MGMNVITLTEGPIQPPCSAQKMKFSVKDFFSKCDQICRFRHFLCSDTFLNHYQKKSLDHSLLEVNSQGMYQYHHYHYHHHHHHNAARSYKWDKLFNNGPNKLCEIQSLKILKLYHFKFLKAVFHKLFLPRRHRT